jgi:hypothetical protein
MVKNVNSPSKVPKAPNKLLKTSTKVKNAEPVKINATQNTCQMKIAI